MNVASSAGFATAFVEQPVTAHNGTVTSANARATPGNDRMHPPAKSAGKGTNEHDAAPSRDDGLSVANGKEEVSAVNTESSIVEENVLLKMTVIQWEWEAIKELFDLFWRNGVGNAFCTTVDAARNNGGPARAPID